MSFPGTHSPLVRAKELRARGTHATSSTQSRGERNRADTGDGERPEPQTRRDPPEGMVEQVARLRRWKEIVGPLFGSYFPNPPNRAVTAESNPIEIDYLKLIAVLDFVPSLR